MNEFRKMSLFTKMLFVLMVTGLALWTIHILGDFAGKRDLGLRYHESIAAIGFAMMLMARLTPEETLRAFKKQMDGTDNK